MGNKQNILNKMGILNQMINLKNIFTLVFFLIFSATYSQEKRDQGLYGSLTGQLGIRKGVALEGAIAANMGIRPEKIVGAGIGIEFMKFVLRKSIYLPVYADFRYFFPPGEIFQAFFIAQPGYGLYNLKQTHSAIGSTGSTINSSLATSGGFYYGTGFGLSGREKLSPTLTIRYASYAFTNNKTGNYYTQPTHERTSAVTLNFGVSF